MGKQLSRQPDLALSWHPYNWDWQCTFITGLDPEAWLKHFIVWDSVCHTMKFR